MLKVATELARTNTSRFRLACIITDKRGHIISSALNSFSKTHPKQQKYAEKVGQPDKVFLHAEIAALVRCRIQPYAIYIARVTKDGKPALAKPCPVCEMAIREAGVKRIYYTTGE